MNTQLYEVTDVNTLRFIVNFSRTVEGLKESLTNLTVAFNNSFIVFDTSLNQVLQNTADTNFEYTLNTAFAENNQLLLATKQFGILSSTFLS